MALANFFGKAALAAHQVLQGVGLEDLEERLMNERVALAFDGAAKTPEGKATLDLSVRLLTRLWPHLVLVDLGGEAVSGDLEERLADSARAINPDIEIGSDPAKSTVAVVVGETGFPSDGRVFYIGSDGWKAKFSPDAPVGSGTSGNPFGAGAAACFGAANLFRTVFSEAMPGEGAPDKAFELSMFDYGRAEEASDPSLPPVDLGETLLVGLGAIGNGALWALSRAPRLGGVLCVIDPEEAEQSNLQRYVLLSQEDIGSKKTDVAERAFSSTDVDVETFPFSWEDYLRERGDWCIERVAAALDSEEDRVAVQAALPKRVFNAWTGTENLGISRHTDFVEKPCLACVYIPDSEEKNVSERIAEEIGLPGEERQIRDRLYRSLPTDRAFLQKIAEANAEVSMEDLIEFEGEPLDVFHSRAVCGGTLLSLATGAEEEIDAPMAFQSALAGIGLAAELVIDAGQLRSESLEVTTQIDLRSKLADRLTIPFAKNRTGTCLCSDSDYRRAYERKYV